MFCIAATNWRLVLLPFLGVSSLDFGPLETAAFFLGGVRLHASQLAGKPLF